MSENKLDSRQPQPDRRAGSLNELAMLGAAETAERIRRREISSVDITRATLDQIASFNPALNAFITVLADEALAAAQRADAGPIVGPLHGVPVTLKDLIATKGIRTTAGSQILANWIPDFNATVTDRLLDAGAILLGKTNLHEFAYGVSNDNPHYGATHNPWDLSRITGGSSGGSAAAVAAGMGTASIGTDTGCSIRIPAAFCGITGLKPTYGRVSRYGIIPLNWSLDHAGPLTRSVADTALLLQVIAGPDPHDPAASRLPVPDYLAAIKAGLKKPARIGLIRDYSLAGLDPEIEQVARQALQTLEGLGMQIEEISLPVTGQVNSTALAIGGAEASAYHTKWLPERAAEYGGDVLTLLMMGRQIAAIDYLQAQRLRRTINDAVLAAFQNVDFLFTPAAPIPVPRLADVRTVDKMDAIRAAVTHFMRIYNVTGLPSLVLPAGYDRNGMPVAIQLATRPFAETELLQLGYMYEQTAHAYRRPPLRVD